MTITKKPVSERALLARLNRKLAAEGTAVRKCRSDSRAFRDLGRFYALNTNQNTIQDRHIDIEQWARETNCLAEWEVLQ